METIEVVATVLVYALRRATALTGIPILVTFIVSAEKAGGDGFFRNPAFWWFAAMFWLMNAICVGGFHNWRLQEHGIRRIRHWAELALSAVVGWLIVYAFWAGLFSIDEEISPALFIAAAIFGFLLSFGAVPSLYAAFVGAEIFDRQYDTAEQLASIMQPGKEHTV